MGHTLTAHFDRKSDALIQDIMRKADALQACRIPYGRDCDRETANTILPYHITLFHWGRRDDAYYLGKLEELRFPGRCHVKAVDASLMHGAEDSLLLKLDVKPEEDYAELCSEIETLLGSKTVRHPHITLAISRDHEEIRRIHNAVSEHVPFPLALCIDGLDLYQIWKPVSLVKSFR